MSKQYELGDHLDVGVEIIKYDTGWFVAKTDEWFADTIGRYDSAYDDILERWFEQHHITDDESDYIVALQMREYFNPMNEVQKYIVSLRKPNILAEELDDFYDYVLEQTIKYESKWLKKEGTK